MPIQIKVSDSPYQQKLITINKVKMFITFSWNSRDGRWYFDLVDRNGVDLISGVKILQLQNLTGKYVDVSDLIAGDFYCANVKVDGKDIEKDLFGTDKKFQFWYISDIERQEIIDDFTV